MGSYISVNDITEYYQYQDIVRLTRPDGSNETTVNTVLLEKVINQAEGLINGFIRTRYQLPFQTIPQIIMGMARFLTYYYLMEIKFSLNNQLVKTYENIMKLLSDLQSGKFILDTDPDQTVFEKRKVQDTIQIKTGKQDFAEDNLKGFI